MGQAQRKPEPQPFDGLSDVEVAAKGICMAKHARAKAPCDCERGGCCEALTLYGGVSALGAVSALRSAGRLPPLPANRPCVERAENGSCMACEARQGEPCQHPSLKHLST